MRLPAEKKPQRPRSVSAAQFVGESLRLGRRTRIRGMAPGAMVLKLAVRPWGWPREEKRRPLPSGGGEEVKMSRVTCTAAAKVRRLRLSTRQRAPAGAHGQPSSPACGQEGGHLSAP